MSRFVILTHDSPHLHWDFMLQWGEVLRTWRLLEEPLPRAPGQVRKVVAETLPDHRLAYLDYEGPVSGGRGSVARWDGGTYECLADAGQRVELRLQGDRLRGRALLEADAEGAWVAQFWSD